MRVGDLVRRKKIAPWRVPRLKSVGIVLSLQRGDRNPPVVVASVLSEGRIWDIAQELIEVAK